MVEDTKLAAAVSKIRERAERQDDLEKLVASYVDSGVLPQLRNENHQILYGRRGTGKTHVVRVLKDALDRDGYVTSFIDCRTLGSTSQFSDNSLPVTTRCLSLFRDLLSAVHLALLEAIVESGSPNATRALDAADELVKAITQPASEVRPDTIEISEAEELTSKHEVDLEASPSSLAGRLSGSSEQKISGGAKRSFTVRNEDKIYFPTIHTFLGEALSLLGKRLVILIDEWSAIPSDIQPYLAEFLKRGMLPIQRVTIKITALEQRCFFWKRDGSDLIGFELGADISARIDLDDVYVFDRNPESLATFYAEVLRSHISLELPDGYLEDTFGIRSGTDFASRMFTGAGTFKELGRACEGVLRDLIHVFITAYFHTSKRSRETIDKKAVVEAARQWFEQDKSANLDTEMRETLRRIVDEVIGNLKARSFLLPKELEKHTMVLRLFDARVIHHLQRGYADKDNPGVRYNIYTLDYGTYVDLIGTSKQPQIEMFQDAPEVDAEIVVPFDDKRSIRRVIMKREVLDGRTGSSEPAGHDGSGCAKW
jgi:hypothetical protein